MLPRVPTWRLRIVAAAILASATAALLLTVFDRPGDLVQPSTEENSITESSYTVRMSPVGTIHFATEPSRVVTIDAHYNDMLVALGRVDGLVATGYSANSFDGFYAQLPGPHVSVDQSRLTFLYGQSGDAFDKETLYALGADIHHIDPLRLVRSRAWSLEDVAEIAANVGPFFANRYSRTWSYPGPEPYEYYPLWELCERVASVYRDVDRIRQLELECEQMLEHIRSRLPAPEDRPSVGLVIYSQGSFLPFGLSRPGFGTAHYRAIGAMDAFDSIREQTYADADRGARLDMEAMLALNPDILIVPWAIFQPERYEELQSLNKHPLGARLSAVSNERLYPGGSPLQGPIFHIFQIEMAAKQIYPEIFGSYRNDQNYPPEEMLFSRNRLAEILSTKPSAGTR